jgi:hypothetical protein
VSTIGRFYIVFIQKDQHLTVFGENCKATTTNLYKFYSFFTNYDCKYKG